jgi:hypothetical protein
MTRPRPVSGKVSHFPHSTRISISQAGRRRWRPLIALHPCPDPSRDPLPSFSMDRVRFLLYSFVIHSLILAGPVFALNKQEMFVH